MNKKDWVKGCDMRFYVGQKVNGIYGDGIVGTINTYEDEFEKIMVRYHGGKYDFYAIDGRSSDEHELPSIYPIELTPEFYQPEWKPREGEWCWFWDDDLEMHCIGQFKRMFDNMFGSSSSVNFENCAPFDKDNMTPPWEKEEQE
jgi:hypothetical protein